MEEKKKLITPHTEPKISGWLNPLGINQVYGKKNYQFFCPKCKFGPMVSAETKNVCNSCNRTLFLVKQPDNTYKVSIVE